MRHLMNTTSLSLARLVISLLIAVPSSLMAESGRGVTSEGKPYRVDSEGNEIVDYIAELEVMNENLQKRIFGLQDELKGCSVKAAPVAAAPVQKDCTSEVQRAVERETASLIEAQGKLSARVTTLQDTLARNEAETRQQEELLRSARASLNAPLQNAQTAAQRVKVLEEELKSRNAEIDSLLRKVTSLTDSDEAHLTKIATLENKVQQHAHAAESLRGELADLRLAREGQDQEFSRTAQALQETVDSLRQNLKTKDQELVRVREELVQTRRASQVVAAVNRSSESEAQDSQESSALGVQMTPARSRAISALKARLTNQLSVVRGLVEQRDALYKRYLDKSRTVRIKPAKIISARGLGAREVEGRLKAVTSILELSSLGRDLSELEAKTRDDIALIDRMSKVR
jgi:chromosome segregation ATPase